MECHKSAKEEEQESQHMTKSYTVYCRWVLPLRIRKYIYLIFAAV